MNKPLSHRDYNPKENFFKNIKNSRIDCNSCNIYTHGLRIEKSPNVVCALRERGDEEMVRILQMVTWAKLKWHVRMWSSPTPTFLGSHVPTIHTHTPFTNSNGTPLSSPVLFVYKIYRGCFGRPSLFFLTKSVIWSWIWNLSLLSLIILMITTFFLIYFHTGTLWGMCICFGRSSLLFFLHHTDIKFILNMKSLIIQSPFHR